MKSVRACSSLFFAENDGHSTATANKSEATETHDKPDFHELSGFYQHASILSITTSSSACTISRAYQSLVSPTKDHTCDKPSETSTSLGNSHKTTTSCCGVSVTCHCSDKRYNHSKNADHIKDESPFEPNGEILGYVVIKKSSIDFSGGLKSKCNNFEVNLICASCLC